MNTTEVSVGKQGRIVIPASLRRQLAIEQGAQLVAWVEDGKLVMQSKQQLWQAIHQACGEQQGVSLADELIADRREAAKQENQ